MTLQECYDKMGGDYADVSARLRSEKLVQRFAFKFLDDKSYEMFCAMMAEKNYEEAFRGRAYHQGRMSKPFLCAAAENQQRNVRRA